MSSWPDLIVGGVSFVAYLFDIFIQPRSLLRPSSGVHVNSCDIDTIFKFLNSKPAFDLRGVTLQVTTNRTD